MGRPRAVVGEALDQSAVAFIEAGLQARKTVKQILGQMRGEPGFTGMAQTRLLRQWSQVWRPMIAAGGRVSLPKRGGDRRRESGHVKTARPAGELHAVPAREPRSQNSAVRLALEAMLDAIPDLLAESPDCPARDTALRAFPAFVRAVRLLSAPS